MDYHQKFREAVETCYQESDRRLQVGYNCQGFLDVTTEHPSPKTLHTCGNMVLYLGFSLDKVFSTISRQQSFLYKCKASANGDRVYDERGRGELSSIIQVSGKNSDESESIISFSAKRAQVLGIDHCRLDIFAQFGGDSFPRVLEMTFGSKPGGYISIPGGQISSESKFWSGLVNAAAQENGYLFAPGWYQKTTGPHANYGWGGGENTLGLYYVSK